MAGVRYRGFDERTELVRWGLPAVALGIVVGGTLPGAIDGVIAAWRVNPSSLPWLFERLFAWLAYLAMAGSVVYGLLLSTKLLDALAHRPVSFALHQDLAAIGVGLAGIHGMLLGLDHSVPFSLAQILVPGLAPHAPLAVAFGQVAMYLALIVLASFYVRRRIGQRAWRTLHYLTFLAFLGATVHGIGAGTDTGAGWAQWIYLGASTVVWFLLVYRIGISIADRAAAGRTKAPVPGRAATTAAAGRTGAPLPGRRTDAPLPGRPTAPVPVRRTAVMVPVRTTESPTRVRPGIREQPGHVRGFGGDSLRP
jgi:sulfoxide reductase heme-binding subunit YedZ